MRDQIWTEIAICIISIAGLVITYSLRRFINYLISKSNFLDTEKEAIQCILDGVNKAQEAIVREAKLKASDGKLSAKDIEDAKAIAIAHAYSIAKGPVKDLLMLWSKERVDAMIRLCVLKISKKK